jgi:hypothetical protein
MDNRPNCSVDLTNGDYELLRQFPHPFGGWTYEIRNCSTQTLENCLWYHFNAASQECIIREHPAWARDQKQFDERVLAGKDGTWSGQDESSSPTPPTTSSSSSGGERKRTPSAKQLNALRKRKKGLHRLLTK